MVEVHITMQNTSAAGSTQRMVQSEILTIRTTIKFKIYQEAHQSEAFITTDTPIKARSAANLKVLSVLQKWRLYKAGY